MVLSKEVAKSFIDPELDTIAYWIASLLKQNTSPVIAIDGKERMSGKSTLAYWLGHLISKYTKVDFCTDNYVWDGRDYKDKIWKLPKYSTAVLDEAALDYYSRRAMSGQNVELNNLLAVSGMRNQCNIFCIPSYWDLDSFTRNRRCEYWFHNEYTFQGTKLIRGYTKLKTNLFQSEWSNTPYWDFYGYMGFDRMPEPFGGDYEAKKLEHTKRRMVNDDVDYNKKSEVVRHMLSKRDWLENKYKVNVTDTDLIAFVGTNRSDFYRIKGEIKKSIEIK